MSSLLLKSNSYQPHEGHCRYNILRCWYKVIFFPFSKQSKQFSSMKVLTQNNTFFSTSLFGSNEKCTKKVSNSPVNSSLHWPNHHYMLWSIKSLEFPYYQVCIQTSESWSCLRIQKYRIEMWVSQQLRGGNPYRVRRAQ